MNHIATLKASIYKKKYTPVIEMLPIQKLTKEERIENKKTTLDLENITQLTVVAKNWINQDRVYKKWVETCEDYSDVVMNEKLNIAFFYKSGIKEAIPQIKNFTRKQVNVLFEAIYFEIIPEILSNYEFKRDYRAIRGRIINEVLNVLHDVNYCTQKALIGKVQCKLGIKSVSVKDSIRAATKKGYIAYNLEATKKFKTDCYKIDKRVDFIDGKWFSEINKK